MNQFEQGLKKYLSEKQFTRIQSIKIGIGGAGGLGSTVAILLVRSGVKHLEILDQDVIEPSNLNRQQYFIDDIGRDKVLALKERLLEINPDLDIVAHKIKWMPETGDHYFKNCTIIVEGFDIVETKHQFVEFYQDKTSAVVSGTGLAGTGKKPLAVKKLGNVYIVGDYETAVSAQNPPMAPRVTQCASIMAGTVIDLILGN